MTAKGPPKVFVRDATGLVKEVSAKSSFVAQWMLVTGGFPIFILTYLAVFPGANFFLALLIGFVPMVALQAVYALFGMAMPRSGGDYIYVTRGLNPFIGFVSSFALAAMYMVTNGIFTVLGTGYLGYQLTSMGIVDQNPALLALGSAIITPTYSFSIAVAILIVSVVIAILRPRYAWSIIFWAGLIAIICTLIMFGALAAINQSTFQTVYDNFITTNNSTLASNGFTNLTTYQQTITAGGWISPSSVMGATLAAYPVAIFTFTYSQLPANWAGEIKQAKRNMPWIMVGGVTWILIYFILLFQLSLNAFGQPFLTSWSALSTNPANSLQFALSDYIPFFTYLVLHNQLLMWAMFLSLFIPVIFQVPPLLISAVRYLFAWSFDRILPEKLSRVSETTHTPILATVIVFVVNIFGSALQAYYPSAVPAVLIPIASFGYIFPALAAIVFPYTRKQMYDNSFVVKRKLAGVPSIVWLGIIAFIGLAVGTFDVFTSGLYPLLLPDYVFYALAYGLGVIIFVAAYAIRKKSGVELALTFREIPPE